MEWCFLILAGAVGALIKDIVKDNKLVFPKFEDGALTLGCLGGIAIGAAVGYLVDQNPTTAFFAGYAGSQMLESLIPGFRRKK
jgi:hypothetical protein